MFKEMRPIGSLDLRPAHGGAKETQSNYLEVVEIGGHRLETELRCEVKSAPELGGHELRPRPQHRGHAPGRPRLPHGDRRRRPAPRQGPQGRRVHEHPAQHRRDRRCARSGAPGCSAPRRWAAVKAAGGAVDPKPGSVGDADPRVSFSRAGAAAVHRRRGRAVDRHGDRHGRLLRALHRRRHRAALVGPLQPGRRGQRRQPALPAPRPGLVGRLAGGDGQHVELGRGDGPADGRRGPGPERPHHRAHDADGEGTVGQGTGRASRT